MSPNTRTRREFACLANSPALRLPRVGSRFFKVLARNFFLKWYLVPAMELCGHNVVEVSKVSEVKGHAQSKQEWPSFMGRDQRGEAMGNMELFLLGVLAGWIPPLIIVVALVRGA